jgi:hypothetical protein
MERLRSPQEVIGRCVQELKLHCTGLDIGDCRSASLGQQATARRYAGRRFI